MLYQHEDLEGLREFFFSFCKPFNVLNIIVTLDSGIFCGFQTRYCETKRELHAIKSFFLDNPEYSKQTYCF